MAEPSQSHIVVDTHVHTIPPRLIADVERGRFPSVAVQRAEDNYRFDFPGMETSPPAPRKIADFDALDERAAKFGIDVQLTGPWTDLLGYTLLADEAIAWTRGYNEALVEATQGRPGLRPMATIPMQFPRRAADELAYARSIGCCGAMVGTDIGERDLGSPDLHPVWEAAAALRMPLLLHPTFLQIPRSMQRMGFKNTIARIAEITAALTRLVYSGVLLKFTDLVVIAALGGGSFVPARRRILRNYELGWAEADTDVEESMRRLYFDSVVLDAGFLHYLVSQVGGDRFVMGSDHPFPWEIDPVRTVMDGCSRSDDRALVLGGNARRLYRLNTSLSTP